MNQKLQFRILIILSYIFITFVIPIRIILKIITYFLIPQNYENLLTANLVLTKGYLYGNGILQLLTLSFATIVISPILEELVFRFWLTKKITFTKAVTFLIFLFMFARVLFHFSSFRNLISNNFNYFVENYINFFRYLFPPITLNLFYGFVSIIFLFIPLFILIAYIINICFIKFKGDYFVKTLEKSLNSFNPFLLIIFSSIIFYFNHYNYLNLSFNGLENSVITLSQFMIFGFGFLLGIIAYKFGIKLAIYLHILINFSGGIVILKDLEPSISILLYSTQFAFFVYILYSIYQETKRLKVFENLDTE